MSDSPSPPPIAASLPTGSGQLFDRDREIAVIEQAVINAKASESQLVLIEGPAGIGKSRLLLEAREIGEQAGFSIVVARGNEFEREYPFGVVRQLIASASQVDDGGGGNRVSEQSSEAADVLAALAGEGDGDQAMFAIFEGLYWATVHAAESNPVMICVDDLQACDRQSLEYLGYLARRIESLPIIIVFTLRPADSSESAATVRELMSMPDRIAIQPKPLPADSVIRMVADRLDADPDPQFASAIAEITEGNPLLIGELLKELVAEGVPPTAANVDRVREIGPRAASRSVLLRLARLSPDCAAVARALTVLGDGTALAMLDEYTGLGEECVARAIASNTEAEIFRPEPPTGFVHPLVREAVYRDIPAGERELMHARAARMLESAGASSERVAAQLIHVSPRGDEWVVEKLRHASSVALSKGAHSSAVSYLTRALAEPPPARMRGDLLRDLGIAEALSNRPEAADHLIKAYDLLDDPLQRGFITVFAMRVLGLAHRNDEAVVLAQRSLAELGPEHEELRLRIENGLNSISLMQPTVRPFSELKPLLDDPVDRGETVEARMLDGAASYGKMLRNDPAEECVPLALRAVEDGQLYKFDNGGFALIGVMVTLAVADDERAIEVCDRSLAEASVGGAAYVPAVARGFKGLALTYRGDLQGAFETLELSKSDVDLFELRLGYTQISAMLALACIEQGDLERGERELAYGAPYLEPGLQRTIWLGARLALRVEQSKNQEAVEVAEMLEATATAEMIENPGWLPWRSLKAEALDGLGRTDEALELAAAEVAAARRWGAPRALGRALRVLGQLKRHDGLPDLEESVALLKDSPARLEYGWALAALGTALRHERKQVDAREPLSEALEVAARAGAVGLERHARDELAAAGASPRVTDFQGMAALTPSERRVAALAVEGMTNREIAQSLFVTPKTVEVHLGNVYKKLDIKSRRELPDVFVSEEAA